MGTSETKMKVIGCILFLAPFLMVCNVVNSQKEYGIPTGNTFPCSSRQNCTADHTCEGYPDAHCSRLSNCKLEWFLPKNEAIGRMEDETVICEVAQNVNDF